ncbi:MAG: TVP38/TMEM64 family protein [bacterium]
MVESTQHEIKQSKWPLIISLLLLLIIVASYFIFPGVEKQVNEAYQVLTSGNKEKISSWVSQLGIWGPIFIIVAMIMQMFLLVIPSPLLMVVSVLAYGPFWGAFIAICAVFAAATIGYWIGRLLGVVIIYKLVGQKKEEQIEYYVDRYGAWAVVITRISPMLSNDIISFVSGILKMGYWKFIGATVAGITPLAILIAYFGENNDRLKNGLLWTSVISLVIFIIYIIYDRKKNPVTRDKKKGKKEKN